MAVDKTERKIRSMFGEIAPRYDLLNHLLSMSIDKRWRKKTVGLVPPLAGAGPILDLCTGTGDLALAFHRYTGGRSPITAADFCPEMLAIGCQKRDRADIPPERLEFLEADSQDLPFPSDHYAVVSVAFGLRNVADTDRGLREMVRVCRPGGKVAVLEFTTPTWQPFRAFYQFYFRNVLPKVGQWLARNKSSAYEYLPESVGQFPQGAAMCDRMRSAGLRDVAWTSLTGGIAALYVGVK